jgi:4-amino-4-deoxy-L-arabinose transferase-like glycosyltransferase
MVILAATIVILYGAYLRCGSLAHRQLWHDEAWRAQTILHASSYLTVEKPIQLAEYLLGKFGVEVFGPSEIAFRIWSFAAAVAALAVYVVLSLRMLSPPIALLFSLFVAASPGLVEHAQEFKSYSLETLFVAAYLLLFTRAERLGSTRAWGTLFGFFLFSMLFSNSWVFFFFVPIIAAAKAIEAGATKRTIAVGGTAAVAVSSVWVLLSRHYTNNLLRHGEFAFWERAYLSSGEIARKLLTEQFMDAWSYYAVAPIAALKVPSLILWSMLACALLIGPLVALSHRNMMGLVVIIPFCMQTVLSFLSLYPFMTRVSTFFYPCLLLSLFYLLDACLRPILDRSDRMRALTLSLVTLMICVYAVSHPRSPRSEMVNLVDFKTVLGTVDLLAAPDDVLLYNIYTSDQVAFYGLSASSRLPVVMAPNEKTASQADFDRFIDRMISRHPGKQVWSMGVRRIRSHAMLKESLARYGKLPDIDVASSNYYLMRFTLPQSRI